MEIGGRNIDPYFKVNRPDDLAEAEGGFSRRRRETACLRYCRLEKPEKAALRDAPRI